MTEQNLKILISKANLLTGQGGPVQLSESQRRMIALFDNGVAVIVKGERWSAEVKVVLNNAQRRGYKIENFHEVEPSTLIELYNAEDSEEVEAVNLELDRQVDLAKILQMASAERASDVHIRVLKRYAEIRIPGLRPGEGSRNPCHR